MKDSLGRNIDYLRISVTDKCNLRCKYCMPEKGIDVIAHEEVLTLEEITKVVKIMESLGIKKVRFTGGEPLVRRNLVKCISDVNEIEGIENISLTTNGVLLGDQLDDLVKAGVNSINISLDTLDKDEFENITRSDAFEKVFDAMKKAIDAGLKVKINCVPCVEFNENSLVNVASIARDYPVDVRFIELMPVGCGSQFHGIESDKVREILEKVYGVSKQFVPKSSKELRGNGPAKYIEFEGFKGKVGFISPMSHQFCSECNRVRLTAEGLLKLCLHYNSGIELKPLLRGGLSDDEIREKIAKAIMEKPKAHDFKHMSELEESDRRKMVQIGG